MKDFTTIATFSFQSDYAILRLVLDQHQIRYIFLHETTVGVLPFYTPKNGGIQLQVYKDHVEQALQIIKDLDSSSNLKIV